MNIQCMMRIVYFAIFIALTSEVLFSKGGTIFIFKYFVLFSSKKSDTKRHFQKQFLPGEILLC